MLVTLAACGPSDDGAPRRPERGGAPASLGLRSEGDGPLVVFLGDSLTAGPRLARDEAFPALVHDRLEADGVAVRVINAGVSGDTSAGGRARLDWLLDQEPDVVFVALGANDGLRQRAIDGIRSDLRTIVQRIRAHGAVPLLAGQKLPPNYGPAYTRAFAELYPELARDLDVPFLPFLLEGVAAEPGLNLPDGLHPNARGHRRIAELVLPLVREELGLLDR